METLLKSISRAEWIGLLYLLIINLIALGAMRKDKFKAKNSKWRISENSLIFLAVFGGSFGELLGMLWFKHKTNKKKFYLGIPLIYLLQRPILFYFIQKF